MAQHHLDVLELGAVFQQVQRKGMAESVGRNIFGNTGAAGIVFNNLPKALPGQAFSIKVQE